jgi:hypothetical protein
MAKSNRHVRRGGHFKAKGDQRSILIMRVGSPLDPDRSPRLGPTPSIPRHALAGVVTAHCYGAAGAVRSPVSSVPDPADCQIAFDFGATEFVDLEKDGLEGVGGPDPAFDVIGGDIQMRSAGVLVPEERW